MCASAQLRLTLHACVFLEEFMIISLCVLNKRENNISVSVLSTSGNQKVTIVVEVVVPSRFLKSFPVSIHTTLCRGCQP